MGGIKSAAEYKARPKPHRAWELAGAREGYTKKTGREPTDVRKAGLYKDFTSLEKKQYASLMQKKNSIDEDMIIKKTLLGG